MNIFLSAYFTLFTALVPHSDHCELNGHKQRNSGRHSFRTLVPVMNPWQPDTKLGGRNGEHNQTAYLYSLWIRDAPDYHTVFLL